MNKKKVWRVNVNNQPLDHIMYMVQSGNYMDFDPVSAEPLTTEQLYERGYTELHIKYQTGCVECGSRDEQWVKFSLKDLEVID